MAVKTNGPITRDDLQTAFSRVLGEGGASAREAVPQVAVIGGAAALAMVALAYLAGRRRGRHRSAVVEVRRV